MPQIELYNNYAIVNDAEILRWLVDKCTDFKKSKFAHKTHLQRYHGNYALANKVNRNLNAIFEAATMYPWCPFCANNIVECLIGSDDLVPVGLVDIIPKEMLHEQMLDHRIKPVAKPIPLQSLDVRDYQEDALDAIIEKGRGVIQVPTGGGKTEIAIAITAKLGLKTVIVVPTIAILGQFIERFKKYGLEVGIFGGGKYEPQQITVAVVNSICDDRAAAHELLSQAQVLIMDEHHRYGAVEWYPPLLECEAYYRIGQSATPWRDDQISHLKMIGLTGVNIDEISINELQDKGKLVDAEVIMQRVSPNNAWCDKLESYVETYREGIVSCPIRNEWIVKYATDAFNQKHKVMILVAWDEHARLLLPLLPEETMYLKGGKGLKKTDKIRHEFIDKEGGAVLVATTVGDLGFDAPPIDMLIIAGGGKSMSRTIQRAGRALRISPGKEKATIVDFYDNQIGLLSYHSKMRIAAYKYCGLPVRNV